MRSSVARSGALRLAMVFAIVFAVGATLYVGLVHYAVQRYARASIKASVEAQIAVARSEAAAGPEALLRHLRRMPRTYFSLYTASGAKVAGTIPPGSGGLGWSTIAVPSVSTPEEPEDESLRVLAKGVRLADGALLVVGRNMFATDELVEWLDDTAFWSALGIVMIALGAGWLIASVFLRRLDRVNAAIERIMSGAFAERIPAIGMGAEFDRLASRLNAMLDQIMTLMESHRQLSTNIAHDLRTPLTRVHQRLGSVRDGFATSDARDEIESALLDLDEVLGTFGALLRLGTIESGALRARFRRVDLDTLLTRIDNAFAPVAEDSGKVLEICVNEAATVLGDPELLLQLVTNLVENALIHTRPGTCISIALRTVAGNAEFTVADNGFGIPAAERAKVTGRFYRLETSRETPGAGLGLALAQAIVILHGGHMILSDNQPGLKVTVVFAREKASSPG